MHKVHQESAKRSRRVPRRGMALTKRRIRSTILLKLRAQKEGVRKRKSRIIKNKLFHTKVFKNAKSIMCYVSFGGEVDTKQMIKDALKLGKIISVPVCTGRARMRPALMGVSTRLKKNRYGIPEPAINRFIDLEKLDLVLVPGLAFDRQRNRLGRGKGYYDSFLRRLPKRTSSLGLAFDFQILPTIPATKRDVKVSHLLFA